MFVVAKEILRTAYPSISDKACELFIPYLNKFSDKYQLSNKAFAAFLAHLLHESGGFRYVREIWGNTSWQKKYERDFSSAWKPNLKRTDRNYTAYNLGNNEVGDGKLFMGRGLLGITGRANYRMCSVGVFGDDRLLKNPSLLEAAEYAVQSAFWWCFEYRRLSDEFETDSLEDDTRKINGSAMLGLDERKKFRDRILVAIGQFQ